MQVACCYKQVPKKPKTIKRQMLRKILRKSQPNFQHQVKKIEAQAKKWFSKKKKIIQKFGCRNFE